MAPIKAGDSSSWVSKRSIQPNFRFSLPTTPFKLDKGLLAKKSAKISELLDQNPYEDLTIFFQTLKTEPETLEIIARFCHGLEVHFSSNTIIPLICLTNYLQMNENYSPNNLLNKSLIFLEQLIFPNWAETVRSLRATPAHFIDQAIDIGLFDDFLSTLIRHVVDNPCLLAAQSTVVGDNNNNNNNNRVGPVTRRKLFGGEQMSMNCGSGSTEDLTSLPLRVYELIISAIAREQVPQDYITASLFQYVKKNQSDKEVIEAVERLLPSENYIFTPLLIEFYGLAVSLEVDPECLTGLEIRIGKQLDRITLTDLLALDLGVENLKRVLKGFYGNYCGNSNNGLVTVAELMEQYLGEIAKEIDLDSSVFTAVAEMVISTTLGVKNTRFSNNDAIYRAVDVYLDRHKELSELQKEEICRVIDFDKMSKQVCGHATQNPKLPLRVVVRALFVAQLQLRDDIIKAVGPTCSNNNNNSNVVDEEADGEVKVVEDEDERREIIDGGHKRSCCGKSGGGRGGGCGGGGGGGRGGGGRKKGSLWKEVKRKFGCMSSEGYQSVCDCNCQLKKRKK